MNQAKNDGATPVYIACQNGHTETVTVLLERGANQAMKDGATPLYIARLKGHTETATVLLERPEGVNASSKELLESRTQSQSMNRGSVGDVGVVMSGPPRLPRDAIGALGLGAEEANVRVPEDLLDMQVGCCCCCCCCCYCCCCCLSRWW